MGQLKQPLYSGCGISLSVCVIGRNEGRYLRAAAESLRQLDALQIHYETLFIDSASSDGSPDIAQSLFDKVICLAPHSFLNAGAARRIGTLHARGNWILYLDGDMELAPDILPAIVDLVRSDRLNVGMCGFTENVYPDGKRKLIHYYGNSDGSNCSRFGGAVLLPRIKVLEAGNWSGILYAYEELELYSRLLRLDINVVWHDQRLVMHKTPRFSLWRKLFGVIVPYRSHLGKKFYGAGQVTLLTIRNGGFLEFARIKPEWYIMLASVLGAIVVAPFLPWAAIFLTTLAVGANMLRLGVWGAINSICVLMQLACGVWKLHPDFHPTIEQVRTRYESTETARDRIA